MNLQKIKDYRVFIAIILIAIIGSGAADRFNSIKLTSNPSIYFNNAGDTLSNRTAGTITTNSIIKARSFIGDTTNIANNLWQVSPAFTLNSYRKTSPTIQGAITAIDSGTIYIAPGVYSEKLTIKSKVALIGAGVNRTMITTANDSCVVYGTGVTNFTMSNLTISATQTSKDTTSGIILRNNYLDSTNKPNIVFDNIAIIVTYTSGAGESSFGIIADSSSMTIRNSYIKVSGTGTVAPRACIKAKKGSVVIMLHTIAVSRTGSVGQAGDAAFHVIDTRCKITYGYCQFSCYGFFNSGGVTPVSQSYFNMSRTDPDGGFSNMIPVSNNTYDGNFYIQ